MSPVAWSFLWTRSRWGFSFVTWDYEIAHEMEIPCNFFGSYPLPRMKSWQIKVSRDSRLHVALLHVTHVFRPGNNRKIRIRGWDVLWSQDFFSIDATVARGDENPKYHRLCTHLQPVKRSSNGSGSLALFKDMAPYQPLDGCESQASSGTPQSGGSVGNSGAFRVSIALQWESCTFAPWRWVQFLSCLPWLRLHFLQETCWWVEATSCDWESVINLTLEHPQLLSKMVLSSVK